MAEMEWRSVQEDRPRVSTSAGQSDGSVAAAAMEVIDGVDLRTLL